MSSGTEPLLPSPRVLFTESGRAGLGMANATRWGAGSVNVSSRKPTGAVVETRLPSEPMRMERSLPNAASIRATARLVNLVSA